MAARALCYLLAFGASVTALGLSSSEHAYGAGSSQQRGTSPDPQTQTPVTAPEKTSPNQKSAKQKPTSEATPPLEQLIVVTADSWNTHRGELQLFESHQEGRWQQQGAASPVSLGRRGMAWGRGLLEKKDDQPLKKEGDGRSPAGIFHLGTAFGVAASLPEGSHAYPYLKAEKTSYCVEDTRSENYNHLIDLRNVDSKVWRQRSPLLRQDGLFEWAVVVEHNTEPTTIGAGSCIFLHVWRGAHVGTAGCTAMPLDQASTLVSWLKADAHTRLVQLPREVYDSIREEEKLPALSASPK